MRILGISAFYHDSAAALVEDGSIVAAAQEERFSRKKHDRQLPMQAIDYCLTEAGITLNDVDNITFYEKPFLKFERLLETYLSFAPRGFASFRMAMPIWLREKLFQKSLLRKSLEPLAPDYDWEKRLLFTEHHQSHAASAFFPSPFQEAAILTLDGVGEWATTSVGYGSGNSLEIQKEIHFPHSLGLLYAAFTYYTGFRVNSGEYKVMGLAPYGEPRFLDLILDRILDLRQDGSYRIDQKYFDYCTGLTMTNSRFHELFGAPPRKPDEPLTQRHMDLAASVQEATEQAVLAICRSAHEESRLPNLCLAGGVALNCVANGKLLREGPFDRIWIQPAAGDAGGALGAALSAYYQYHGHARTVSTSDSMAGSFLGPTFKQQDIEARLREEGANYNVIQDEGQLIAETADALAAGRAVGWFQGRMEFGPRALGSRSILADPRSTSMQRTLNLKIKYREDFRPFAPSILAEDVSQWFDLNIASPYMLIVADVHSTRAVELTEEERELSGLKKLEVVRSEIPAVTHVNLSARVQTVHSDTNPRYHALLNAFKDRTGCPVLVNTSFNVRGEPIVCTPEDAFRCFMGTELDVLIVGNCILLKTDQDEALKLDYKSQFELD
ncbi:MAG: carbamoyltransferase [SAR202 cluster bacterium]|nr:carbamoyltransferase [SAR202 cluster bacterium]